MKRIKIDIKISIICAFIILILLVVFITSCTNKVNLTCDDATKIAMEKVENGIVVKCELNRNNYEIEITHKEYEYEFIINGKTGEIISFDSDTID